MIKHIVEYVSNPNRKESIDLNLSVYPWPGLFRVLVLSYRYEFNQLAALTLEVIKRESKSGQETQNDK
jgi:hypothetical protein